MFRKYYLPIFLILAAVSLRVLRHFELLDLPPNFAPITAVALFAGAYLGNRRLAVIVPVFAMLISDIFIGFYDLRILAAVYLSFIISGILGFCLRRRRSILKVCGAALSASILFFLITNFAVWLFSGMYPLTAGGLWQSYLLGLPFFKYTLLGDIFYVSIMFGLYELVLKISRARSSVGQSTCMACMGSGVQLSSGPPNKL